MLNQPEPQYDNKIGIIAGDGDLPAKVVEACEVLGRDYHVISVGKNKHPFEQSKKHTKLNIGAVGKAIRIFKQQQINELVLAGNVVRPSFSALRPDASGIKLLARISKAKFSGDNSLLSIVIKYFEEQGFSFVGIEQVVHDLLVPEGIIGSIKPTENDYHDINYGKSVAQTIGDLDIGQSVVVQQGVVLGVEAAEGTDALIQRCGPLQQEGRAGILVKMKKPNQDQRVDLPTIGVQTIINAHQAGLGGVAIEAGGALIIDRNEVSQKADTLGIFLVGVQ